MATTKVIQSLERATMVLDLFQKKDKELSLKEITDAVQLNKSTTFGLVNSLTYLGYLMQNTENQKYSLGTKILALSSALKMNNILIRMTHPYLETIAAKYSGTVHSAIDAGGDAVIYLDKVESDSSIVINTRMGVKNYMHCTGVGKCILAYKDEDTLNEIITFPLVAKTYNTITTKTKLYKELKLIKKQGYAMDNEEIEIGLSCIAVPIFSSKNQPGFAISISGATSKIQYMMKHTSLIEDLMKSSRELSLLIYHYNA